MLVEHDVITASISGNEIRGTVVADNDSEGSAGVLGPRGPKGAREAWESNHNPRGATKSSTPP